MGINAQIAQQNGVPSQLTGRNGDLFVIAPEPSIEQQVSAPGRVPIDQ